MTNKDTTNQVIEGVKNAMRLTATAFATSFANASVDYKKAVAERTIQAQAELRNFQLRVLREMPTVELVPSQVPYEYQNYRNTVTLTESQAFQVFNHMLIQCSLNKDLRVALVKTLPSLVGIPNMLAPIYYTHRLIAETYILPTLNADCQIMQEPKVKYSDIVSRTLYRGANKGIIFEYHLKSFLDCGEVCNYYYNHDQYLEDKKSKLKRNGLEICKFKTNDTILEVYLKWAGA